MSHKFESYYLRILVKDISGVLAKITSNLNEEGISIETILQTPDKKGSQEQVPIIIVTHETTKKLLNNALTKIEKLKSKAENQGLTLTQYALKSVIDAVCIKRLLANSTC